MAKKQTRRSISVRGVTYNQLRDHCAGASISMSDFIEQRIADYFVDSPVAVARPAAAVTPAPRAPAPHAPAPRPQLTTHAPDRRPASVARVQPVLPAPMPRPVPASSAINRPLPVAARRAVSPPMASLSPISSMASHMASPMSSPMVSTPLSVSHRGAVGRPAPTPAAEVLKERLTPATPRDAKDYRALRF